MIEKLLRLVRALVAVIGVLSGVLLVASVALNFANVVGRYFFNASIPWAEEAMLFLMVGCVFLGNGVVAWPVIRDLAEFDQRSQAADFPLVIPQAMVPIGLSIMAFLVAVRLLVPQL